MDLEKSVLSFQNTSDKKHGSFQFTLLAGIFCTFLLCLIYLFSPPIFQYLDYRIYDIFLQSTSHIPGTQKTVIVDIDEQSLKKYGQWPWPRYLVAELLEKTNSYGPATVTLDVIFSEPDRTSLRLLLESFSEISPIDITSDNIPDILLDNDRILSDVLETGPFVLATKFHFDDSIEKSENCLLYPVTSLSLRDSKTKVETSQLFSAKSVLCNIPELTRSTNASGFFNINPDRDGILRRAPLLIQYQDKIYPSLALASLMKSDKTNQVMMNYSDSSLESIGFQKKIIPVDPNGQILIKFRGPRGHYKYISAADILDEKIDPEVIKDKMVFLGTSAAGLKELRATPFDPIFPGVEIHASIVDTILTGDFIITYNWVSGLIFILIIIFGIFFTIILARAGALWGLFFGVSSILILWFGAQWAFHNERIFFPLSHLIFSIVLLYLLLTVFKFRQEEQKVLARTKELLLTQDSTIESMATLAEYRDPETGGHIKRTREYIRILAEKMQENKKYEDILTESVIDMLYKSAPLHDIGKVGVPDHILLKPDDLTEDEFEIMKRHTLMGRDVIRAAIANLGRDSFLKFAEEMAYTHQEKWDGSGYPQGLQGEDIPISGRLMALADVYDALISRRPYKKPYPHQEAINSIKISSGKHFAPDVVDAFLELEKEFRDIAFKYADNDEEREMLDQ